MGVLLQNKDKDKILNEIIIDVFTHYVISALLAISDSGSEEVTDAQFEILNTIAEKFCEPELVNKIANLLNSLILDAFWPDNDTHFDFKYIEAREIVKKTLYDCFYLSDSKKGN